LIKWVEVVEDNGGAEVSIGSTGKDFDLVFSFSIQNWVFFKKPNLLYCDTAD